MNDNNVSKTNMDPEGMIDMTATREWEGVPGSVYIPEAYIKDLNYEIIVFARKERGGSDFSFRCHYYYPGKSGAWVFDRVIIDTSRRDAQGNVESLRITYHPSLCLINIPFMVIPYAGES